MLMKLFYFVHFFILPFTHPFVHSSIYPVSSFKPLALLFPWPCVHLSVLSLIYIPLYLWLSGSFMTGYNIGSLPLKHLISYLIDLSSPSDERGQSINKPMKPEDYQKIEQDLQNQLMSKKLQEQRNQQAQQRVNSWNFNFDSSTTNDMLSHCSPGSDYDSILGEEEEETFYSMSSNHELLPPLEEPELPMDMLKINRKPSGSNLLHQTTDFSPLGTLGVLQSSPCKLLTNTIANDKRFVNKKIHITGENLLTSIFNQSGIYIEE